MQTKHPLPARTHNFSPGPAILPEPVLLKLQESIWNYQSTGRGIAELSHRGKEFQEVLNTTKERVRSLFELPERFKIVFATGGATQQFESLARSMNGQIAYLCSGVWSELAYQASSRVHGKKALRTPEEPPKRFTALPSFTAREDETFQKEGASYLHFTSNNTIAGTQYQEEPKTDLKLICDASSDIASRPIDVERYSFIYAGAQKNLGIAGVTLIIVDPNSLRPEDSRALEALSYWKLIKSDSAGNTPPTLPIYVVMEVLGWIEENGGLKSMAERAKEKARILYDILDEDDFYKTEVPPSDRSLMNVVFNLPSEELLQTFLKEAETESFFGLKGHRLVGGVRASIYNACPIESVKLLGEFMRDFRKRFG